MCFTVSQGTMMATEVTTQPAPYSRPTAGRDDQLRYNHPFPRRGSSKNVGRDVK